MVSVFIFLIIKIRLTWKCQLLLFVNEFKLFDTIDTLFKLMVYVLCIVRCVARGIWWIFPTLPLDVDAAMVIVIIHHLLCTMSLLMICCHKTCIKAVRYLNYCPLQLVFLLCRCSPNIFDVFPSVLVCNTDLFFVYRFMNFE